jgi:hypothetical protein
MKINKKALVGSLIIAMLALAAVGMFVYWGMLAKHPEMRPSGTGSGAQSNMLRTHFEHIEKLPYTKP